MRTHQVEFWSGEFGRDYTDRNTTDHETWNRHYMEKYGVSRLSMNHEFLQVLPKDARILEVGCNTAQQLEGLRKLGFTNLSGLELQFYAAQNALKQVSDIPIVQASGFEIPFKTGSFDLVFTSGVLIHIAPNDLPIIMGEMHRCTSKFIWGFEYYSDSMEEVKYRENAGVLWKADHASMFIIRFPDLTLVTKKHYPYIKEAERGNVDCMFLLEKHGYKC